MMGVGWDEGDGAVAAAHGESDGTVEVEAGGAGGQRKSSSWDAWQCLDRMKSLLCA